MKIVFYDINLLNHKNYIGDIIDFFINRGDQVIILYDEYHDEAYHYFNNKNCQILLNKATSYRKINIFFKKHMPDIFIVNAQRLSDSAFISIAKKYDILTIMIQHGMYIPFLRREKYFLIKKINKTIKYFKYSQVIARTINEKRMKVFFSFYKTFIKGYKYKNSVKFYNKVNTDYVLVYGKYWKYYHQTIFGYNLEQQYIIGYHELRKINSIKKQPLEKNSVCYIAQTLVEDGRLDLDKLTSFLNVLEKIAQYKKVYVKLHPRSNIEMYKNRNFELLKDNIPYCEFYLGHYSSLMALVAHLNTKVVLYEFPRHDIPDYFKKFAINTSNYNDLENILLNNSKINIQLKDIEYFFSKTYDTKDVGDLIISLSKHKEKIDE